MRLLLDEMHAPAVAAALVERGWDVVAVAAEPTLRGLADVDLLNHAVSTDRAVVTENVVDFAPLAALWASTARRHCGLIFTDPSTFNRAARAYPGDLIIALDEFLKATPIEGESWVWWL